MTPLVYNPNGPKPVETFHLRDNLNTIIPPDIRQHFQCDGQGRVLFFSNPPLDVVTTGHHGLGHSIRYLAAKEERQKLISAKKKENARQQRQQQQQQHAKTVGKRQKIEGNTDDQTRINDMTEKAWNILTDQIQKGTRDFYKIHYGGSASCMMDHDQDKNSATLPVDESTTAKVKAKLNSPGPSTSLKRSWMSMDDIG